MKLCDEEKIRVSKWTNLDEEDEPPFWSRQNEINYILIEENAVFSVMFHAILMGLFLSQIFINLQFEYENNEFYLPAAQKLSPEKWAGKN